MLLVFVLSSDTGVSSIIPNNTYLDEGKNMGGKIYLMAHMDCYVPTDYEKIPLFDKVKVLNLNTNQEMEHIIVSSQEANLGKSLIGRMVGEIVEVKVPAGVVKYKILEIRG